MLYTMYQYTTISILKSNTSLFISCFLVSVFKNISGTLSESVVRNPCGKRLSGLESGEFVSPGYPDTTKYPYAVAVVCDIIIEVPRGKVVDLQFIDFDLPGGRWGDYVSVRYTAYKFHHQIFCKPQFMHEILYYTLCL